MEEIQEFHDFYKGIYESRWEDLFTKLTHRPLQVARLNKFLSATRDSIFPPSSVQLNFCFEIPADLNTEQNSVLSQELKKRHDDCLKYYVMDPASVLAARLMPIHEGQRVLDMCAAPGGKSLILAEALNASGELWCNELSIERRERLKKVLQQYIPQEKRMQTWIKGLDGIKYGLKFPNEFDCVLLDAPCSGEAHLIQDKKMLQKWTVNWTKKNAARQYGLISSAYLALKAPGFLVYSTCSLSPTENEEVIEKILHRRPEMKSIDDLNEIQTAVNRPDAMELTQFIQKYGERRRYGHIFLPDHCGFGPFYFCLLKKNLAS
ncbi:MAG: RsmB/NOP family class I SAM-dependent RNA methyltransferase [Pseudobdellovibrionaceae bacterium]